MTVISTHGVTRGEDEALCLKETQHAATLYNTLQRTAAQQHFSVFFGMVTKNACRDVVTCVP